MEVNVVECRGTHRQIGRQMGEALREPIRESLAAYVPPETFTRRAADIAALREAIRSELGRTWQQLQGLAEGANIRLEDVLAINLPFGPSRGPLDDADTASQADNAGGACTNVGFTGGPDGPLIGKNNDGRHPPDPDGHAREDAARPFAVVKVYPDQGLPACFYLQAGWLSGSDAFNAEGLAIGHSSVGSRLQRGRRQMPIRPFLYEGLYLWRSAGELGRALCDRPTWGKGYATVVADAAGTLFSAEIACPLTQIRQPGDPAGPTDAIHCVNRFQLENFLELDGRDPAGLRNADQRIASLNAALAADDRRDRGRMAEVLTLHAPGAVCRHGGEDLSHTEWSFITCCRERTARVCRGNPCSQQRIEVRL